jgi:NAD dependent epimerase/dehydratase family enzyme
MMTSWIDMDDLMRIYHFVIDQKLTGVFNAVSPNPVTNYVFTKALGKVLHRPTILPIPEFALRIMYGEASSVLTGSKEIYPSALQEKGFVFEYTDIEASLRHQLS